MIIGDLYPIETLEPIHPAMIITKQLTNTDFLHRMVLPGEQIESVLAVMDGVTAEGLRNGMEVDVYDATEEDEYKVTIKCVNDGTKYVFGKGWSVMKYSLDLLEGQELKLYWHRGYKRFIVLNFQYTLLMI
ncbi:B3 domain-containing protein [Raphanus sativus]|uniref:B3 domain-containing protein At1g43171-like n=1 Tax=Raphanus sativus TaxID=3726 RepID=A0A6J0MTZ5_RAPSA|nr:B3 domain-containing protein At1g43171-like [Raphanus sativus]XP_018475032.2 B3 domain-containing protein At1g43171-like [Raphanus sativus]XP_018475033.2 B3 domain-containing protein At1g43171-like [Raphanus sativus]KAJ4906397.1 B3 domain-containing protein [Raphanus sativus]